MPNTTFTFEIPELTPSLNKLVKGRTNWRDYRRLQQDWFYRVKLAIQDIEIPSAQDFELRRVLAVSYRVSLLDKDNLEGGMKILWDAMVDARLLYDDGPKFLEKMPAEQVPVRKKRDEKSVIILTIF